MDENSKRAYRHLIYQALVDIRNFAPQPIYWNPYSWWRGANDRIRIADFADAMHNLAQHSWLNFERFEESRFWEDYDRYCRKYPNDLIRTKYRQLFDDLLKSKGF
ncbi:MAG: hypothetical protein WC701_07000 [Kiritimatiellales bacterium]|jgi:hypothetical protein